MKCPKCHAENTDTARFCSNCAAPLDSFAEIAASKTMTVQKAREVMAGGRILAGKYRIIEPIGKGGMGVVYKAEDTELERTVALKFLPTELTEDQEARERFVREAKAAAALSDSHICDIHEIGKEENQLFIVMEYIHGESLKQKISKGAVDQTEALAIAVQVAKGLEEAHKKGIVHRDIKPGNIMVTYEGTAKVMDFGLAKALGKSLITKEAKTMGTVAYMSPEQAQGQSVDHRTDIWSLGVVFYEMLTGQLPFKGDYEQSVIHSILNRDPEPITKIREGPPAGLDRVIGKALEKKPADRYQSMEEFLVDLKAIAEGLKPLKAKPALLRGRIFGLKKIYAFAVLAFLVALAALAIILLVPKEGQAYDSIAVLPLENLSRDPEQEFFSDGMHEALITELSRIKAIKVISRTSVMGYKATTKKIPEIARELGVAAIVEGTTVRSENMVRINIQLIDGRTDRHLWADSFDREYRDILTLQSEAALAIAKQIRTALTPEERTILARSRPVNPEAYEAYQKAMFIIGRGGVVRGVKSDLDTSRQYLDQALKIDPDYAAAYAGLAVWYDFYSFVIPGEEAWPKAKEAALKAISLDDSLAEAYFVLADMKTGYEWDWEGGEKAWKRVFEIDPNYAYAHAVYGTVLAGQGRNQEALVHADRARELDPRTVTTLVYVYFTYTFTRQYDRGIALAEESLTLFPSSAEIHIRLSDLYALKGMPKEAIAAGLRVKELVPGIPGRVALARGYKLAGETTEARDMLNAIVKWAKARYETGSGPWASALLNLTMAYAELGEIDKAFGCLDLWYQRRSPNMYTLRCWPFLDNLHSDPRFSAMLKKIGLEK